METTEIDSSNYHEFRSYSFQTTDGKTVTTSGRTEDEARTKAAAKGIELKETEMQPTENQTEANEVKPMSKAQQIKLIDRAYSQLQDLNNIDWTPYRDRLYQMALEGERRHRTERSAHECGISATVAAKLFAVKWIAEYLKPDAWLPQTKDFLSVRKDCFYAAALVLNYRELITEAWKDIDTDALTRIDYADLMQS